MDRKIIKNSKRQLDTIMEKNNNSSIYLMLYTKVQRNELKVKIH